MIDILYFGWAVAAVATLAVIVFVAVIIDAL